MPFGLIVRIQMSGFKAGWRCCSRLCYISAITLRFYNRFSGSFQKPCELVIIICILWARKLPRVTSPKSSHSTQGWSLNPSPDSNPSFFLLSVSQFSCLVVSDSFATPWTAACQASLSITNSWSLLKLRSIESVMPSNHLILCHPLLLPPSVLPSIRVFSNASVLRIKWPKYWSFSLSISPSNEYSGLISFKMDWFDPFQSKGLS